MMKLYDDKGLPPKLFKAGNWYKFLERTWGFLILLEASDGKASWIMMYRLDGRSGKS